MRKPLQLVTTVIALFAMVAVLAQPVCQAYELGHEPHGAPAAWAPSAPEGAELCCVDDRVEPAASAVPAGKSEKGAEEAAAVSSIAFPPPQAAFPAYHLAAARPPTVASYYARSARILR